MQIFIFKSGAYKVIKNFFKLIRYFFLSFWSFGTTYIVIMPSSFAVRSRMLQVIWQICYCFLLSAGTPTKIKTIKTT